MFEKYGNRKIQKGILKMTAAEVNMCLCTASQKMLHTICVNEILWFSANFKL
jgi:hypothetical protein